MTHTQTLEALPAAKWRCQFCGTAYQELRAFRVRGKVELGLKCHRCGRTGLVTMGEERDNGKS